MKRDNCKQSLYFPRAMLEHARAEAERLDRSLSWVIQYAYRNGRHALDAIPSVPRDTTAPKAP